MKKFLYSIALALILGAPALSQDTASPLQTETIATVTTVTGSIEVIGVKPLVGDDRPTSKFVLIDGAKGHSLLLPGYLSDQDEAVSNLLTAVAQQGAEITVSGELVKHSNKFGERTSLIIRTIEVNIVDPDLHIEQRIVITFRSGRMPPLRSPR